MKTTILIAIAIVLIAFLVNPVPGHASRPHGGGIGTAHGGGGHGPGPGHGWGPRVGHGWGTRVGHGWGTRPWGWGARPWGWGPGWAWGLGWGLGWGFPYWGYPYGGYPYSYYGGSPAVIEQQSPTYVEPAPQPEETYSWYYCQNPRGYYPYVEHCPGGWTKVSPSPPAPGQ